ncbi:MAG: hypothetical protein AB8G77_09240 [Rhodothermales bacterium]
MRFKLLVVLLLLTGSVGLSCKSSNSTAQLAESVQTAIPEGLKIVCGEGGGFTGRWGGFTVYGGGDVWAWHGMFSEDKASKAGSIPEDSVRYLWHKLEAMDFFALEKEEYANMTAVVAVEAGDSIHRVSWPPKVQDFEAFETPLDSFYVHCLRVAGQVVDRD